MKIMSLDEIRQKNYEYQYFYNSPEFHMLNKNKVEEVVCCVFGEKKIRAGWIFGIEENIIRAPYSSPFSMIELFRQNTIEDIDHFFTEFDDYALEKGIDVVYIKLPPIFYDETNITKVLSALLRAGYNICEVELNYQLFLKSDKEYLQSLHRNAKKNLNHALEIDYELMHCENEEEKFKAFDIIKTNRESKKYQLRMTWEEVKATINLTNHDFFLLKKEKVAIASAIIFQVTQDIYQVIYWGDIPGYSEDRPMNILAYQLYKYYCKKGIRALDIGPSMIEGHPNYGLCDFKESIGCDVSGKFVLRKEIRK